MYDRASIDILLVDVRSIFDPRHLDASDHILVILCCIRHDLGNMFYVSVTCFHGCCENLPSHEATKPRSLEASKHRSASTGIAKRNQLLFVFYFSCLLNSHELFIVLWGWPFVLIRRFLCPAALTTVPTLGAPLRVALADIISKSLGWRIQCAPACKTSQSEMLVCPSGQPCTLSQCGAID